ncbi:MAG: SPASM domain-containing protein [Bacilli bacterium]|nr:SPASM domain-containing protein [Bacilli bacterium]
MIKEVKIEVTEECKRWCVHCSSEAKEIEFRYLDYDLVKRIIDEAVLLKASSVVFTGGEATLYPEIEHVISYAHKKGLQTKLYTMCNPELESIDKIRSLNVYGLDEAIYSTTYHLTRDNIVTLERLQTFFPELLKQTDIKLGLHHAITGETVHDVDDVVNLFFSLPDDRTTNLSFLRFVPHGRGTKDLLLSKDELLWFREKMLEFRKKYGNRIRLGSPWNFLGISHTPCNAAEHTMIVGFDGRVYPCDAMKYFDYLGFGGNIYEHTLEQIYRSQYFQNVRNLKNCVSGECMKCSNFAICRGGCLGQKMIDFMEQSNLTFQHYGDMAKRTMNHFDSEELKNLNGKMGIVGEIGELIDFFKKYKTHNLDDASKKKLLTNLEVEIGDIIWYLAASLSSSYQFEFEDIGNYLFRRGTQRIRIVNDESIIASIKRKDPECFKSNRDNSLPVSYLDSLSKEGYSFHEEWKSLVRYACEVIYADKRETVLEKSACLLVSLSRIASVELGVSMEQILKRNIEKLKARYQTGFDSEIASSRVELLTAYKESEPSCQKVKV